VIGPDEHPPGHDFGGYTDEDEHPLDTWAPNGSIIFDPPDWADD
jgi:hypothetical protein